MIEIKVVKPTDEELNCNNYLVKQIIDYFNASVLSRDYNKHKDEMVIEVSRKQMQLTSVMDEAIKLINDNGWQARHGSYYSTRFACPSYAIYFKPKN